MHFLFQQTFNFIHHHIQQFLQFWFAVRLLLFKWQIRVLQPVAPAQQAYSDSFIFLDRNRFTKSTNRKGGKKKHVREAVTAHFSWTWPLGSGPWAAISSHSCVFRPPSIPNNRPGSWPYSRRVPLVQGPCQLPPCFCVYSTMITVLARKAFAFHPFFSFPCDELMSLGFLFLAVLTETQPTPKTAT